MYHCCTKYINCRIIYAVCKTTGEQKIRFNPRQDQQTLQLLTVPANKAQMLMTNMMLNTAEPTTAPRAISSYQHRYKCIWHAAKRTGRNKSLQFKKLHNYVKSAIQCTD